MFSSLRQLAESRSRAMRANVIGLLLATSGPAFGQTISDFAVVDDVTIYLAVLPAEMLRTFPPGSEESRMHGGVPGGRHVHHVQVALFDAKTGARLTDAEVVATVAEVGLGGTRRTLDPFTIGDAETYGGYFELQPRQHYKVGIQATFPDDKRIVEQTFDYEHQ